MKDKKTFRQHNECQRKNDVIIPKQMPTYSCSFEMVQKALDKMRKN